jgi:8-oxo-dGTP pyrophosphatase MutT (NUDIX family)
MWPFIIIIKSHKKIVTIYPIIKNEINMMENKGITNVKRTEQYSSSFCNNCGKTGHYLQQCKTPITSTGVIIFRVINKQLQYLLIRRKDTLGFIDFMRGKYSIHNKHYIMNMMKQMTVYEKNKLRNYTFTQLWFELWGEPAIPQYKTEEIISREKFNNLKSGLFVKNDYYSIDTMLDEIDNDAKNHWTEPEWGFPKGRRNHLENDYECAIRECCEETGFSPELLCPIKNILPYEEICTGSNYKSYKHKYFVMYLNANDTPIDKFQKAEVSKMEWKTYEDALECIRFYNFEKKKILKNVNELLCNYSFLM